MTIDPITHRRLALVRQLYQHAAVGSSHYGSVDRIVAATTFDLAVETALKAVMPTLDPSKSPKNDFEALVQQVNHAMLASNHEPLADQPQIHHVHSIRNDAQHKARYPSEAEVNDCRTYTRDFLKKLVSMVWSLDFEAISLVDLVQHPEVRTILAAAEVALGKGEFREAVERAAVGINRVLRGANRLITGRMRQFPQAFIVEKVRGRPEPDGEVSGVFERMEDILLYLTLGLDYTEHIHFRQVAGDVKFVATGDHHHLGVKENLTAADAEFTVAYAVNTVLRLEARVGDVDTPLGLDRYGHPISP